MIDIMARNQSGIECSKENFQGWVWARKCHAAFATWTFYFALQPWKKLAEENIEGQLKAITKY